MTFPDPDAFADLLCDWCLRVGERDYVLVFSTPQAAPLVRALHRAVIARGAWAPGLRIAIPGVAEDFYKLASDELLDAFPPQELAEMERIDAYLRIDAPGNTRALADVDPAVLARAARARSPIQEARMGKRWCGTLWPTPALAQEAGMSDDDYAAFVERRPVPRPSGPGGGLARAVRPPGEARRAPRPGARDPHRGGRDRPAPARRRSHLDQLGRQAQHAERRGVHRPARGLGQRDHPVHDPLEPARRARRGRHRHLRGREGRERHRGTRPGLPRRRARHRPGRPASSASSESAPTPASTGPPGRSCSTRRWPGRSTSRSAAPTRRPADATSQPCTGI